MKSKKEIEEKRMLVQELQEEWDDYERGYYNALCWVLGDRHI